MNCWTQKQLTFGTAEGVAHAHSYYDIQAVDGVGERILVHALGFSERQPTPDDEVAVGYVHADHAGAVVPLGTSRAWSWQQGPMAQWVAGGPWAVWNDRETGNFVARLVQVDTGEKRTLARPVYAVSPDGCTALALDMGRLDHLRPGYGYPMPDAELGPRTPANSGVWSVPLDASEPHLILSLEAAVGWLRQNQSLRERLHHLRKRYHYWFNHAKFSPDGKRFTVKLRWRQEGGGWSERQGISLTAAVDGTDLRLLADATSHVIWQTSERLYMWRKGEMALFEDSAPKGRRLEQIGEGVVDANVHLRHLPPGPAARPEAYVFDTPYAETVTLNLLHPDTQRVTHLASFDGHVPARGPFRCDLHPVPSPDGRRIFVTSLQDGARQVYVMERTG